MKSKYGVTKHDKALVILLWIALILIIIGGLLARLTHINSDKTDVRNTFSLSTNGLVMSSLLYDTAEQHGRSRCNNGR
jgi:hypothetical protein